MRETAYGNRESPVLMWFSKWMILTFFVLVEVYRTPEDPAKHKQTAHYQKWRDTVEEMMAVPRESMKYNNVFPDDTGWE